MKLLLYLIIFLICTIVYMHIIYHLKTSSELEVYDIDYTDSIQLNKICDLRQPFTFKIPENSLSINKKNVIENNYDINIIQELQINEKETKILSEYNYKIIEIPTIKQEITSFEKFIKPTFNITTIQDIIIGDKEMCSKLKHTYNYRNFFYITQGSIKIRFIPPNYTIHLNHFTDYETLNEVTDFDIWNESIKSIEFIEINATTNDTIFIPPYWWYSFCFQEDTTIISYKYRTIMNNITILPKIIYSFIAIHNKKQMLKTKSKKFKNKKTKNKKVKFNEKNNEEF